MRHALLAVLFGVAVLLGASSASGRSQSELDRFEADVRCKGLRCEAIVRNTGQRALDWIGFELSGGAVVTTLTGSNRGSCNFEASFGACRWLNGAGQAAFPIGARRTLAFQTNPAIDLGTRFIMCGGGTTNDQFCTEDDVEAPESDLELDFTARARVRFRKLPGEPRPLAAWTYHAEITNLGPSPSPGATFWVRHSRPLSLSGYGGFKISCRHGARQIWRCNVQELALGETAYANLETRTSRPALYVARASVIGQNPDPHVGNNRVTRTTRVLR